jgi:tyrosyl-tRNA synthetase
MSVSIDKNAIVHFLTRGVERVYPTPELLGELLAKGKPITVYNGYDPTGSSLHIGHAITLRKLGELQRLGHKVIMLIGDFTAMIGDPTDKLAMRKQLTREEVMANCKNYKAQASRFLSFDGPNAAEMKFNSEWLAKLTFGELIEIAAHFTVQQMLERDMFEKRMAENKPVHLHEFFYPLMQGYDSVVMDVDLETGGNDQTFNMLAGRTLMREMKQKEKFVLTCKLLVDSTGKKMGKSEGNMITLEDSPVDMYGKVMSWTDGMIMPGFELCTDVLDEEMKKMQEKMDAGENPMLFKQRLAKEVVSAFLSLEAAEEAAENFVTVHQKHERPEEIPEMKVNGEMTVIDALVVSKLVASKGEARRQIEQGGVKVNDEIIKDGMAQVGAGAVIQKGKRFFVKLV